MNHDDIPIGSHTPHSEPLADQTGPSAVPEDTSLGTRLLSKTWKTRFDAFAELAAAFSSSENLDLVQTHGPLFKKYLADAHPGVQEKALEAFSILLDKDPSLHSLEDTVTTIIEKCTVSMKVTVREKAMSVLLKLAKGTEMRGKLTKRIVEDVGKCKVPKIVAGGIQVLVELIKNHGKAAFKLEEVAETVEKYAVSSNNAMVRNEALGFYRAAHLVFEEEEVMTLIKKLKPAQREELTKDFQKEATSDTKENETRVTTSAGEEEKVVEKAPKTNTKEEINYKVEGTLNKFKEEWCSQVVTIKKWSEKRDKLEELLNALAAPLDNTKICPDLVPTLRKLINDNNIVVAQYALKVVNSLAAQLKADFVTYQKMVMKPIIFRLKDKKVVNETQKCLETMAPYVRLEEVLDDVKDGLNDKSPAIRTHLCQWLEKSLLPNSVRSHALSELGTTLAPLLDEAMGEVRESATACLGIIQVMSGKDPVVQKVIAGLNSQKTEKLCHAADAAKKKLPNVPEVVKALPKPPASKRVSVSPGRASPAKAKRTIVGIKPQAKQPLVRPQTAHPVSKKPSITEAKPELDMNEENSEKTIEEVIPQHISEELSKSEWKERLKGFQDLNAWLCANKEKMDSMLVPLAVWIKGKLKDFKESNQAILKEAFTLLAALVEFPSSGKKLAWVVVPGVVEKMADSKWFESGLSILLSSADCAGPALVANKVMDKISSSSKNVNLVKAALSALTHIVEKYEAAQLPLKELVNCAKQCIGNANPSIRSGSISLFTELYKSIGEPLRKLLTDLKEATLKTLEAELAKISLDTEKQTRKLRGDALVPQENAAKPVDSLFPRIDISPQINQKLLNNISDPGIKVRQEAKEQLERLINSANGRIQANNLSPLINALKGRMNEPCKTLAKGFISLVGNVAAAMGAGFKQYSKIIIQPLIGNLGDKQGYIRTETVSAIDKVGEAIGPEIVINSMGQMLEKDSFEVRSELLKWIIKHQEVLQKAECGSLVNGIVSCVQDKAKEIREKGEKVLGLLVPIVGTASFASAIKDLKPTVKSSLRLIIEKYESHGIQKKNVEETKAFHYATNSSAPKAPKVRTVKESPCKSAGSSAPPQTIEPVLISMLGNKEKRAEQDKAVKWGIDEVRDENVDKLKKQLKQAINPVLFDWMFSGQLKKQLSSIKSFIEAVKTGGEMQSVTDILDLLFKWNTMLLVDQSNTAIAKGVIELLKTVFEGLLSMKYQLFDFEAASILPMLCERIGSSNSALKEDIKELITVASQIYSPAKVCNYIVRALDSKHQRTKIECLGLLKEMVMKYGLKVITARDIKAFGKILVIGTDAQIKSECVELLGEIYKMKGEAIWGCLGDLNEKVREILGQKFKQIVPEVRPKTAPRPSYVSNVMPPVKAEEKASPSKTLKEDIDKTPTKEPNRKTLEGITKMETIDDCINLLMGKDISKRVDALVFLSEKLTTEGNSELAQKVEYLVPAFADVLHDVFERKDFPVRFAKYFLTVLNKFCAIRSLVHTIPYQAMEKLMHELLTNLLHPGLEKVGDNNEGEAIMKSLNGTMLCLLEKCNPNKVFRVLIELYRKAENNGKLPELIVKCVLKLTKVLESLLPILDIADLLLCLHEYLCTLKQNSQHNDIGIRVTKTIVNELVKAKREAIWDFYKSIEAHSNPDSVIKRWITLMLNNTKSTVPAKPVEPQAKQTSGSELKEIFAGLNSKETFEEAIVRLSEYRKAHPECDLTKYFQFCSKAFTEHVMSMLDKHEIGSEGKVLGNLWETQENSREHQQCRDQVVKNSRVLQQNGNPQAEIGPKYGKRYRNGRELLLENK
eukprot:TRINITY_DN1767_c0_g1_i1.p1 TRINITY_DN1767_c0_g1~~TRINITY_DN1767_c0_g1_i1.p1  ORF type:complete len:1819 (+),score=240.94 TRINITY_DN1767_c0_g1_i1:2754-8210(+)